MEMARVTTDDVEVGDCYTYTVLVTLEDYGFCKKGEGGEFAESGASPRAAHCRPTPGEGSSPATTIGE